VVPRIRPASVPLRPATASERRNALSEAIERSSRTTSAGLVRFARERPDPSATCGRRPNGARRARIAAAPCE